MALSRPQDQFGGNEYLDIAELFDLYGDSLTNEELADLRKAWEGVSEGRDKAMMALDLVQLGYAPTRDDIVRILKERDHKALALGLEYAILRNFDLPNTARAYQKQLNLDDPSDRREWLLATRYLLAVSGHLMPGQEKEERLEVIRRYLFSGAGDKDAYAALVALAQLRKTDGEILKGIQASGLDLSAFGFKVVDVKSDVLRLAHPGEPLNDMKEQVITALLEWFADTLTDPERAELKDAWKDNSPMLALFNEKAAPVQERAQKATKQSLPPPPAAKNASTTAPSKVKAPVAARPASAKKYIAGILAAAALLVTGVVVSRLKRHHREEKQEE